jgi:hypothetical protein
LDWPEVTFDTELNGYVVYTPATSKGAKAPPGQGGVNARVTNKYTGDDGQLLYDLQLEEGEGMEVTGVRNDELELQAEQEAEAAAVFVKSSQHSKHSHASSYQLYTAL